MNVEFQPAYLLHARPYRDTSLLATLLTQDHGKISCVVRGIRKSKSPKRNLLNPFQRLLVSVSGAKDLKLITSFESDQAFFVLEEKFLFSGLYINELLLRVIPEQDPHEYLFKTYEQALARLSQRQSMEICLREFENSLLAELGYAIAYDVCLDSQQAIAPEKNYCLQYAQGFVETMAATSSFSGESLLAIARQDWSSEKTLRAAKQINRELLKPLLGNKPLLSRSLF